MSASAARIRAAVAAFGAATVLAVSGCAQAPTEPVKDRGRGLGNLAPPPAPPRRLIWTRRAAGCERAAQRRTGSRRLQNRRPGRSQLLGRWVPPQTPGASAGEGAARLCARAEVGSPPALTLHTKTGS